jgi:DNA-binding response OmpR family regulator
VRALLRRAYPETVHDDDLIRQGDYIVDARRRVIALDGQNVDLSPREFDLALFLFRNIGRLLSRDVIEQAVWGRAMDAASRTLDTYVAPAHQAGPAPRERCAAGFGLFAWLSVRSHGRS